MFNTISLIGQDSIGLPTATQFASRKKKVIGVDVNQQAVNTINQGRRHIVEPELEKRQQVMDEEMLRAEAQLDLIKDLLLREPGL